MQRLDILIPTRNRISKLKVCVESIKRAILKIDDKYSIHCRIVVYADSFEECDKIREEIKDIEIRILEEEYKAPNFWNNWLKKMGDNSILCYLNDDVCLDEFCLNEGLKELESLDWDGVVGFYQSNQVGTTNCGAAFGLISSKFADRFPNRKVMCPDYWCLYIDEELKNYSSKLNRFIGSTKAKLEHYHPSFTKEFPDETYTHLRRNKQKDIETHTKRRIKGLIWGESFELIND